MNRARAAALLALPLLALAALAERAGAICIATPPRMIEAVVRGCRPAEEAIRQALEPYREAQEEWLGGMPVEEERRESRSFDRMIESTLERNPGLILTLEPRRYRRLSADPRQEEEMEIGPWEPFEVEEQEPREREHFLRTESLACDDLTGDQPRLFLEDLTCCDVIPSSDAACLLRLPALVPLPPELEAAAAASP